MATFFKRIRALTHHAKREQLANTFTGELHFQSYRSVIFGCWMSAVWLPYITVDAQLYPDKSQLLALRWALLPVGLLALLLALTPYFRQRSQYLVFLWSGYVVTAGGYIAGFTAADPNYVAGFMLCMCLMPMAPIAKRLALGVLVLGLLAFSISALYVTTDFALPRVRYSINDVITAFVTGSFFIFLLDYYRHRSWYFAKLIENESKREVAEANEKNAAKGRFLATMSHEIRTPMNGIIGLTELVLTTNLEHQQRQYLEIVNNSGKALLSIINDILDYSKIEAGKLDVESVEVNLEELCWSVSSAFDVVADGKHLEFIISSSPATPAYFTSDPTRLRQILLNLIGNAFKFTAHGGIYVNIDVIENNVEKPQIKFSVTDTGIGMTKEQAGRLFQAFQQASISITREYGGTGLGLNISKRLAELLGGSIGVESIPNKESTFWFSIPCIPFRVNAPQQQTPEHQLLAGKRVLFLGCSTTYTNAMLKTIALWNMQGDGVSATDLQEQLPPHIAHEYYDIICVDNTNKNIHGLSLAKQIKAANSSQSPDIILFTSMSESVALSTEEHGLSLAIKKPSSAYALKDGFLMLYRPKGSIINGANLPANQFTGVHVMVAEDNTVNQIVIINMLKKLGVDATLVNNGRQAVNAYKNPAHCYDLIFMDCEMPELNGFEATKEIRALEQENNTQAITIVALTAHATQETLDECIEIGMSDWLTKPIELAGLHACLSKHIKANHE